MSAGSGGAGSGGTKGGASYAASGVDVVGLEPGLGSLVQRLAATTAFPRRGRPGAAERLLRQRARSRHRVRGWRSAPTGWARSCWSRSPLGRFDTIGIDLIAMNVNDVLCVGAEPIALVDYIAVSSTDPDAARPVRDRAGRGRTAGAHQHSRRRDRPGARAAAPAPARRRELRRGRDRGRRGADRPRHRRPRRRARRRGASGCRRLACTRTGSRWRAASWSASAAPTATTSVRRSSAARASARSCCARRASTSPR